VASLSGGQKQRLYFALSIAGDPDLLFLDEPTVAMDVESRRSFWEQVRGFATLGKTILLVLTIWTRPTPWRTASQWFTKAALSPMGRPAASSAT
jgi:energy-coupling factor transporter ATP-binding protein EcfA2